MGASGRRFRRRGGGDGLAGPIWIGGFMQRAWGDPDRGTFTIGRADGHARTIQRLSPSRTSPFGQQDRASTGSTADGSHP